MGYTTEFYGQFRFNKPLDDDTYNLLIGLASTRRMKRFGLHPNYGKDGEFYFNPNSKDFGQEHDGSILDRNSPPSNQPGLWLQWRPTEDRLHLVWDGGEKFYHYVEWLEYLIKKILEPKGYSLSGSVDWAGEDDYDRGTISLHDNLMRIERKNLPTRGRAF